MTQFNYALELKEYTWSNALLWGNFSGHARKTAQGSLGGRIAHLLIAAVEFLPIVGQVASIFEKVIVTFFSKRPTVAIELKPLVKKPTPDPYRDPYKEYHIRQEGSPERMQQYFDFHKLLWEGSARYREIVMAIETRKGQPVAVIDGETAIQKLSEMGLRDEAANMKKFEFPACWHETLNAVVLLQSDDGSTMAFEMTNGYQQTEFDEVHRKATNGEFINRTVRDEKTGLELAATAYAHANENIENKGRTIHEQIIDEAIQSGKVTQSWHWHKGRPLPPAQRLVEDLILSEYGQSHIGYYERVYKEAITPYIKASVNPTRVSERMKNLALRQHYPFRS